MSAAPGTDRIVTTVRGLGNWHRSKRRGAAIVFVMAILLLALLCSGIVGVLSSARAYVGGESLYTKGQKNAVRYLGRYLRSRDEADYRRYLDALDIPLGDRIAQLELEKPRPDYAVVRRGFLQGGNDPGDLGLLIGFYRLFRHLPLVAEAIDTWAAADDDLLRLQRLGQRIHEASNAGADDAWRPAYESEIDRLDEVLNAEELRFSRQLGQAARWVQGLLLLATAGLALALITCGLGFARMLWMRLAQSQQEVEEGNARWTLAAEAGQLGLMEWRVRDDTVLLDPRAIAIYELAPAAGDVYPAASLRQRVHPDDRPAMKASAQRAMAGHSAVVQRFRVLLPSGRLRHLEVDGRAFMADGRMVSHMVGLVRDVTEEVSAQDALLEEGAAQRTYQAKREFLSRVSHELRTPLNAVIGFSDLMRTDPREPLTPSQMARLDRVVDGGQYLLRLVNDLLDVARLEVGEMSIALSSVRLAPVLRNAVELLETARVARGVTISMDEPPPQLFVVADPVRLKQVFVNILSNAIKYNRVGGTVYVAFSLTPTQAVLTVRDQGAGMTPQQQRDLFVPFRRLGDANATEGAGLGLVISRHLAERQGGSLDVASAPGQGTTVTIRLNRDLLEPVEHADFEAATSFGSALAGAAGVVVYIEDDPVNVLLLEQYVALCADVQLLVARDGASGLALARQWMPNLVLLDMQLPDMSGLDVLDRLRADPATSGLRVVALSADAMPAQVTEAIARGAEAYWTKPLALAKFKSELPKYLR